MLGSRHISIFNLTSDKIVRSKVPMRSETFATGGLSWEIPAPGSTVRCPDCEWMQSTPPV